MTFLKIYKDDNCIAEVCGIIAITENNIIISICSEDKINAIKLIHNIEGGVFCPNRIMVPIECVNYIHENSQYNKESIVLTNDRKT